MGRVWVTEAEQNQIGYGQNAFGMETSASQARTSMHVKKKEKKTLALMQFFPL